MKMAFFYEIEQSDYYPRCSVCTEHDLHKDNYADIMKSLIDQFYPKSDEDQFDPALLENNLEDLASYFDLRTPKREMKINWRLNDA